MSTLSIDGLFARAAFRPLKENDSLTLPDLGGALFTKWTPILLVLLTMVYMASTQSRIPMAKVSKAFKNLLDFTLMSGL